MERLSKRFKIIEAAANKKWIDDPVAIDFSRFHEKSRIVPTRGVSTPFKLTRRHKNYRGAYIFDARENFVERGLDFCIRFSAEPFGINKKISDDKINCPMIKVGAIGIQNTGKTIYTFDGCSAVYNSRGEIVQLTEPFEESLNFIELEEIDKMPPLKLPEVSEAEKIYRAVNYGVKEFLSQIGMSKVVIGVSGGIDSAVAAALYVQVLGTENVYLVNMPSKFNSLTTKNLSEQLAKNLGCKYFVVPIQESVDWTVKQLEERGIEVSSFVKENVQARDRSSRILAAIAASVGGVFTCNANKAESTVGYATLYGDEAGFLSALADLWKYQVYDLARYMNGEIYKREVIPQGIIDIVPSAELSTAQNVDEGKGDPLKYPYHDYLFRAFVEYNLSPESILRDYKNGELEKEIGCEAGIVEKYFPTAQEFIDDLERWWKAFTGMGVAKRIQSPPILAVTQMPFGARAESQNGVHFTKKYFELKNKLLAR
ncbi:MAG: NAD(+) synthase [Selenomonadaceae bacterium]|nr:NAD(+) synthase [Selenomonadaceae bacterium]